MLIGAGNVAWHMGHVLSRQGIKILQVCNRSAPPGFELAESLGSVYVKDLSDVNRETDIIIIAVSDDVIGKLACSLGFLKYGILVHTAGGVHIDVLSANATSYGVFYPLQTFTKGRPLDFKSIPLIIEANDAGTLARLRKLAVCFSDKVYEMNSEIRMILHLTAVLTSNFSNHLIALSEIILKEHKLPLDLLNSLLTETLSKAFDTGPGKAQTGPAVRGNRKVIEKHLELLRKYPQIQKVYLTLSESLMQWKEVSGNRDVKH